MSHSQSHRRTLGPWDPGTLGPWDPGTLGPWDPGTLGPLICSPPVRHVTWCHKIHNCATYGNPPAAVSSIENQTKIHKTEIRKSVERSQKLSIIVMVDGELPSKSPT